MVQAGDDYGSIDSTLWLPPDEGVLTEARKRRGDTYTVESDPKRGGRETYTFENPLLFYLLREHITGRQYRDGNRFHCLWRNSVLRTRYAQTRYTELRGGAFDPDTLQAVPKEYLAARAAIRGEPERAVVYAVCCEGLKAGKRGQMVLLRDGLDDLGRFFKARRGTGEP